MKTTLYFIVFLLFNTHLIGQIKFSRIIVDAETKQPINSAHVYINNKTLDGAITNMNVRFVINGVNENSILTISHISYLPISVKICEVKKDTILLVKNFYHLAEVKVNDLSTYSLMEHVLDSLKKYYPKQVMYLASITSYTYEPDSSFLNILNESIANVYHKSNRVFFKVIKARSKAFSERGKRKFKNNRMVAIASIASDNLFFLKKDDIFYKGKLNLFNIQIVSEIKYKNNTLIKIKCSRKKKNEDKDNFILYIDEKNYLIKKYYLYNKIQTYEIGFKVVNDQLYLDYSIRQKLVNVKEVPPYYFKIMTIYNIDTQTKYSPDTFQSYFKIVAQRLNNYTNDWDEEYWENYNFIPLPEWVKEKIKNN
ncbi:MAG: carboxypeptidase-like regulatory domain-containing protein [Bacteroidales bacterium]|nr:carboxypeptidase-like regulatory domain-containing protein [Bacteroidales bacterium]